MFVGVSCFVHYSNYFGTFWDDSFIHIMWNGADCLAGRPSKSQFHSFVHMWSHPFLYRMSHFHRTGHQRFRLSSKKNAERKNYSQRPSALPVSIPLSDEISVHKVSLPINLLSFNVSLPLKASLDLPANSLETLQARLVAAKAIPQGLSLQSNHYVAFAL